jgi:imidazolonepropionase
MRGFSRRDIMLIHSASQLLTLGGSPQRGDELGRLGIIQDGALLIDGDRIVAVGPSAELIDQYPDAPRTDVSGKVVLPGFIDPHTHVAWAGDRANEFEERLEGKSYLEILAEGGGILSTVRETREATLETLVTQTRLRLWDMFAHGTTTLEAKSGYGLRLDAELKMLEALIDLDAEGPWDIAVTFLGAHAVPKEYAGDSDKFTQELCSSFLPAVKQWWEAKAPHLPLPFVDVFCETGAFNLEQSRLILMSAKRLGFGLKIHADEFDNLGGASLAVDLGAASADHLVKTSSDDILALGESDVVAVGLPCTPFGLAEKEYTPAKALIDSGAIIAIASDINPGTAWCGNMQFTIALACRYMRLTPAQAIAAATINAAHAIRRANQVGSIEVGKQADLLVLSVPDYRQLGYRFGTNLVKTVIKSGVIYEIQKDEEITC